MPLLLIYNQKDTNKKNKLKDICDRRNYILKEATDNDLDQKIGYLVELEGYEKEEVEEIKPSEFDFTFLLIKDVPKNEMYSFLEEMQKEDLYIPNKAGLTDTNKDWTLRRLLFENEEEHRTMELLSKITNLFNYAEKFMQEHGKDASLIDTLNEVDTFLKDAKGFNLDKAYELYEKLYRKLDELNRKTL